MAVSLKIKILTIVKLFSEPKIFSFLLSQRKAGYLYDQGWFNAFKTNSSVDKDYQPIPWMTYSFIDFVKERINKDFRIFEFGSGNSTLFFAKKVKSILAVEHNSKWYELLKTKIPSNVNLQLRPLTEEYQNTVNQNGKYDIIIVDGENRNECIYNSVISLDDSGVLILDDSERINYSEGINFLIKSGFNKIDFWGIAPGIFYNKCTTIFYRNNNCLKI